MAVYEEVLVYVYFYGIALACGVLVLFRKPSWTLFFALSTAGGLGGILRPTLVFYGFATLITGAFIMWQKQRSEAPGKSRGRFLLQVAPGVGAFISGGALLFALNYTQFGNGFEFGHRLNVQPEKLMPSVYATHFGCAFDHIPVAEGSREVFGALFLVKNLNGYDWYKKNFFPGQSKIDRWREFAYRTFDLSYAAGIALALLLALGASVKCIKNRGLFVEKESATLGPALLIAWSICSAALLFLFYTRSPVIASRYVLDFSAAFAVALAALSLWLADRFLRPGRPWLLFLAILSFCGWFGWQLCTARALDGPILSIDKQELSERLAKTRKRYQLQWLPREYRTGAFSSDWEIPFNGTGWNTESGELACCAIFFATDPQFVEVELQPAPGAGPSEADLRVIECKVGLELLPLKSVAKKNDTWILRFAGPTQPSYQTGFQSIFLKTVSDERMAENKAPWLLKRITWK